MLDDRRLLELAYSLLLSMPGTPVIPYGDEIGMGDDLSLDGRDAVRTPMQWTDGPAAGFSTADPDELIRPVVSDDRFGPDGVNVRDQRSDRDSFLRWVTRAVRTRREYPVFGRGSATFVETAPESVLCHRMDGDSTVLAVHNLADQPASVSVGTDVDGLAPIFDDERSELTATDPLSLDLAGYGYLWLRAGGGPL
ncbi:alpha-glucosidase C-terminal domain-containing protein [Halosimplex aquaticum]